MLGYGSSGVVAPGGPAPCGFISSVSFLPSRHTPRRSYDYCRHSLSLPETNRLESSVEFIGKFRFSLVIGDEIINISSCLSEILALGTVTCRGQLIKRTCNYLRLYRCRGRVRPEARNTSKSCKISADQYRYKDWSELLATVCPGRAIRRSLSRARMRTRIALLSRRAL